MDANERLISALPSRKAVLLLGLVVLSVQFALAWQFYLERITTADTGFVSFLMIDSGEPQAVLGRYGSLVAQAIPAFLLSKGAELSTVLRTYSVVLVLLNALLFLILVGPMKRPESALILLLGITVAYHHMFYYGFSELYQGLSITVVMHAVWRAMQEREFKTPILFVVFALLGIWASYYHQILVLFIAFFLGYEAMRTGWQRKRIAVVVALMLVAWYGYRILFFSSSSYEQERMPTMAELIENGTHFWNLDSTKYFIRNMRDFLAFLLMICATGYLLIRNKAWRTLAYSMVTIGGVLLLFLVVDRNGRSPLIYENYYPVLGCMVAIPFVDGLMLIARTSASKWRLRMFTVLPFLLVMIGCAQQYDGHYPYSQALDHIRRSTAYMAERGSHKSIMDGRNFPYEYAWGYWPLPFTSTLVTAVENGPACSTLFATADVAAFDSASAIPNQFIGPEWEPYWFTTDHMDQRYFQFLDAPYATMNTAFLEGEIDTFQNPLIQLSCVPVIHVKWHRRANVGRIRITNNAAVPLRSILANGTPVRLTYVVERPNMEPLDSVWTSLELDILPGSTYEHGLTFGYMPRPGEYDMTVSFADGQGSAISGSVKTRLKVDW